MSLCNCSFLSVIPYAVTSHGIALIKCMNWKILRFGPFCDVLVSGCSIQFAWFNGQLLSYSVRWKPKLPLLLCEWCVISPLLFCFLQFVLMIVLGMRLAHNTVSLDVSSTVHVLTPTLTLELCHEAHNYSCSMSYICVAICSVAYLHQASVHSLAFVFGLRGFVTVLPDSLPWW